MAMVVNRQKEVRVALPLLESFLRRVQVIVGLPYHEVTVCLIADAGMASLNGTFRGKWGPTDVLSFPAVRARYSVPRKGLPPRSLRASDAAYLGDIAISPATAGRNAGRFGRTLSAELRVLILHGMLHLMGYDHERDGGEMDRVEKRLRRRLGLQ